MALGIKYYLNEAQYRIVKTFRMVTGKVLHVGLRTAMGGGAAAVASDLSYPMREAINITQPTLTGAVTHATLTTGEIILSSTGGLLSIGLGAGLNGYINHLDHKHRQEQLCTIYGPQLAAMTGDKEKKPKDVSIKDLKAVAEINPTLQEELIRNDKNRRVKNVAAIAGTVAAFAVVFAAVTFFPPLGALAATAAASGLFSMAGMGFAVAGCGIGYATLHFARNSLKSIGKKITGLDQPSVGDKIDALSKQQGKEQGVTPGQVMDVFVASSQPLAMEIESRYGKKFADMLPKEKTDVAIAYADSVEAPQIAKAINKDKLSAYELAFLVHDQFSGVYPDVPWREKIKDAAQEKIDALRENAGELRENAKGKIQNWKEERAEKRLQNNDKEAFLKENQMQPELHKADWRDKIITQRNASRTTVGAARA